MPIMAKENGSCMNYGVALQPTPPSKANLNDRKGDFRILRLQVLAVRVDGGHATRNRPIGHSLLIASAASARSALILTALS
jgi:hypothetical protein